MKTIISTVLTVLTGFSLIWAQSGPIKVVYPTKMDVSPPARDLVRPVKKLKRTNRIKEIPNRLDSGNRSFGKSSSAVDPVAQLYNGTQPPGKLLNSWDGLKNTDNPGLVAPPDPNLAVGPNHVVQMVNLVYGIWDKNGGVVLAPTLTNTLWTGFGGGCEFGNDGDPVVVYDQHADRWLLSQFDFSTAQCIAISTTPDPTGSYYRYSFSTPGNDYPKMSLWNDAYLATIRNFSGGFSMDAHVFERNAMLVGGNAAMVVFNLSSLLPGIDGFIPADIDGPLAPAGTPAPVMGFQASLDRLVMFEITVNAGNIVNSTISGPTFFPVSTINNTIGSIPQRGTSARLDALARFLMYRLAYRNLGSRQTLVLNHTVDIGDFNDHGGVRWYEMRNTGGGWSVFQEGSYAPDSDHRWMGSIALNMDGDIMAGYSVSSGAQYPSIRYAGRRDGDIPTGVFTLKEAVLIDGLGSQTATSRWGDYTCLVIDPSDDRTFWYTNEYYPVSSTARWFTRIGAFDLTTGDLEVTVTPDNPPIIIPTTGGSFSYVIDVENNTAGSKTVDIWAYAARDNAGRTDHLFIRSGVTIGSGQTQTYNVTQNIPPVDAANYHYFVKAGTLVDAAIAGDVFPFSIVFNPTPNNEVALAKKGIPDEWPTAFIKGQEIGEYGDVVVPESVVLEANYPNPFNPTTSIYYTLREAAKVRLSIYNTLGQKVRTLVDEFQPAGSKIASWDATNNDGQVVSAGVYLYRLDAGGVITTKKMTLVK